MIGNLILKITALTHDLDIISHLIHQLFLDKYSYKKKKKNSWMVSLLFLFPKYHSWTFPFYSWTKIFEIYRGFKDRCYTWCKISSKFINTQCFKNPRGVFWQLVQRWEKWSQSWKAHPGGRAEIKNVTWCIIHIFNFSSAVRGQM